MPGEKFSPSFESVEAERLYSRTRPASVVVYDDGTGVAVAEDESSTIDTSTDVSQVINSAVANIGAGGDIFVRRGEYTASNTILLDTDGVRLIGEGMPWKDSGQSGYGTVIKADSNVGNELVALDHQFTGVDSLGLIGQYNVTATVKTTNIRDYRIVNCGINGGSTYNVHAESKNTWIVDNWIEFAHYANIRVSGGDAFHKSLIRGNMLVGEDDAAGNGHIVLTGANEVRILGNTMSRGGLGVWDFGSGMDNCIISDNIFRGIGRDPSPESFSDTVLYSQSAIEGTNCSNNRVIAQDNTGTAQTATLAEFESGATVNNVKLWGNNDTNLTGSRIVDNGNTGYTVGSNAV